MRQTNLGDQLVYPIFSSVMIEDMLGLLVCIGAHVVRRLGVET
jgi:hypothetical protein